MEYNEREYKDLKDKLNAYNKIKRREENQKRRSTNATIEIRKETRDLLKEQSFKLNMSMKELIDKLVKANIK